MSDGVGVGLKLALAALEAIEKSSNKVSDTTSNMDRRTLFTD